MHRLRFPLPPPQSSNVTMLRALPLAFALAAMSASAPVLAKGPRAGSRFADCAELCPEMVVVPPGRFRMGSTGGEEGRPEWPIHEVRIAYSFAVGKREVSNAEYARFIAESGHPVSRGCRSYDKQSATVSVKPEATFRNPGDGAGGGAANMPVVCVSWTDAKAYTAWLSRKTGQNYRLLSEAEWEYAARAGSRADYAWGMRAQHGCRIANVLDQAAAVAGTMPAFQTSKAGDAPNLADCNDGFAGAAPVGSLRANVFGLHDMTGNVWEWVEDCYVAPYPANVPTDGSAYQVEGPCPRRSVRGGSWITVPFRNRPAWRGRDPEDLVTWIFGFRVARDLPAERRK
jgi:formylglycine-generating enzyme required for sulfatase activity